MARMRWFRRRRARATDRSQESPGDRTVPLADPAEAALRFWARWEELLPTISAALGDSDQRRAELVLCDAIAAVHPDLHFSLDRGQRAVYSLVVTGQEDPALRPYTDAWMAAAPTSDVLWEYHDSVPPVPDPNGVTVNLPGHRIRLADFLIAAQVDEEAGVVDVAVYHPTLSELDEPARSAMTFLPLDATLGERLAGERLRRVETALNRPANAITLRELRDLVRRIAGMAMPPEEPGSDLSGT
jgi:hypothetical protein